MKLRTTLIGLVITGFAMVVSTTANAVEVTVTASSGQPYGIATIELPVAGPILGNTPPPLVVTDEAGRVMFPIAEDIRVRVGRPSERPVPRPGNGRLLGRVGKLIREIAGGDEVLEKTVARRVTFLIRGNEPITVRLTESNVEIGNYELKLVDDPANRTKLLGQWWTSFLAAAKRQIDSGDYPPWVEYYMVAMLSGQTGQPLPEWYTEKQEDDDHLIGTLKLLAGIEEVGKSIYRRAAAGELDPTPANLPLPAGPKWTPATYPEIDPKVPIEPIASRVPPECTYLRFGSFSNYLWFRDLSDEYGGDLSRMVTLRGVNDDAALRVEKQLNMKMTKMSRLLGPSVIEDQVLFGRDMFLSDGASIGVILRAKNNFLLRTSINGDRSSAAKGDDEVTLSNVKISGRDVSLLSTSDNRVRSFMAEDGEYFCIANSRTLIKRFLEVSKSKQSLATTKAFRLARQLMPLSRNDTVFAYFSPEMLQGLVEPQYLVELRRRLHAKSDVSLVHLAQTASKSAHKHLIGDPPGIEKLIADGFLPEGFGRRADGSGVITIGFDVIDTQRGARGTFLPIADVETKLVTAEESQWYKRIENAYSSGFQQIDPIMIGVQRQPVEGKDNFERLVVHAEIAPLVPEKYGWLAKQLGVPTKVSMKFAPDDLVAVQAHVASAEIGPPTHLFVGVKDSTPPAPEDFDGIIKSYRALKRLPAYLGAWPQPGAIDRLPLGLGRGRAIGPGMTRLLGGLYRYTDEGFSVLSFQQDVLKATLPFLEAGESDDLATVRAHIGTLKGSKLEGWVNDQLYQRASISSAAGANFLNMLSRQLAVDPAQATLVAGDVLGSQMQCPLGGKYEFSPVSGRWVSTAWNGQSPAEVRPDEYVSPLMVWFRRGDMTLTQYSDRLVADATIILKHK